MNSRRSIVMGIILGGMGLFICEVCIVMVANLSGYTIKLDRNNSVTALTTQSIPTISKLSSTITKEIIFQIGDKFEVDGLKITPTKYELIQCFTTLYGSQECPPEGAKYLWINIKRENIRNSDELPIYSCFTFRLLYRGDEIQPMTYATQENRENWGDGGCKELYASQSDEGWIYFEVPEGIILSEGVLRISKSIGPEFSNEWKIG